MLLRKAFSLSVLLANEAAAQSVLTLTGSGTNAPSSLTNLPTATYVSYDSTSTVLTTSTASNATMSGVFSSMAAGNSSNSTTTASSSSASVTLLVGGGGSSLTTGSGTGLQNGTATATSSSMLPVNTQPCNGHPEFCNRKFSNITMVAAHNSPFAVPNNAASNQVLPVTIQLNDGIRMRKRP